VAAAQTVSSDEDTPVTITLTGGDPEGSPLTYSWSLVSKPEGSNAVLSDQSVENPSFVADLSGTYAVQLVVSDGELNSAPETVFIDALPRLELAEATINGGDSQRSLVREIELSFNRSTNIQSLIDSGEILNVVEVFSAGGDLIALDLNRFLYDDNAHRLTLDLRLGSKDGLLTDGVFELQVDRNRIHGIDLEDVLGDTDGVGDDYFRLRFHQLKNDFDGDGRFSIADRDEFLARLGSQVGDPPFDSVFDIDADGDIDSRDYDLWRRSLRTR
jgi:hypothetical protein